jgi:hypothetical protein
MGLGWLEQPTLRLSGARSNQLSYKPPVDYQRPKYKSEPIRCLLRKEVIQPHLPVRLPCYDLVPLTKRTFGSCPLAVSSPPSGTLDSADLTGGVYKARERIHRAMLMRDY